jgi:hypothetical protein
MHVYLITMHESVRQPNVTIEKVREKKRERERRHKDAIEKQ